MPASINPNSINPGFLSFAYYQLVITLGKSSLNKISATGAINEREILPGLSLDRLNGLDNEAQSIIKAATIAVTPLVG